MVQIRMDRRPPVRCETVTYTIQNKVTLSTDHWASLSDQALSLGRNPRTRMLPTERKKFKEMELLGITECEPYQSGKVLRIEVP